MNSAIYTPYSIKGQTVLITGASSGIGEACAWRFAEAGCRLVLLARRAERLADIQQQLQAAYGDIEVHTVVLDVRDTDAVTALPYSLPGDFREVDILLNNAGLALGIEAADEVTLDDARTMIDSNIMGVVAFTRAFTPGMRSRNRGHVINISSIAAHEAYGGGSVYCATKHALDALTVGARHDFVGTNVRVTAISPGAVQTEFSVVRFGGDESRASAVYEGIAPLVAADIADNCIYAATRPPHVQIAEILVLATYQCSAKGLARVLQDDSQAAGQETGGKGSNAILSERESKRLPDNDTTQGVSIGMDIERQELPAGGDVPKAVITKFAAADINDRDGM